MQGRCMTEIRVNNDVTRISKQCKQTGSCLSQENQNENTCNAGTVNSVCYSCCEGDLCNGNITSGASTTVSTTTTKPTTTTTATTTIATTTNPTTTSLALALTSHNSNTLPPQRKCAPLEPPEFATLSCTDGENERSKCSFICDTNYALSPLSDPSNRCACTSNTNCQWLGRPGVCKYVFPDPIACDMPDFQRGSLSVLDTWPTGALLRVNIRPVQVTSSGWSVALMFSSPIPEEAELLSGHVQLISISQDRRIFTFNSLSHNMDISPMQIYSVYFYVQNMPATSDPSTYSALVGVYDKLIFDASCIQVVSPVRPLPTTAAPPTTTPLPTTSQRATTTQRPVVVTTKKTITTPRPTTARTTTTRSTTTTVAPPATTLAPGDNCEVEPNDQANPGYIILNNGYSTGGGISFNARAQKFPDNKGLLSDWTIKLEFASPVDKIQVFVARAEGPFEGGKVWLLHPMEYNDGIGAGEGNNPLQILFIGSIAAGTAPEGIMTFCRNGAQPSMGLSGGLGGSGGSVTTNSPSGGASTTTEQGPPLTLPTQAPSSGSRCSATGASSFGSLPTSSAQTNPNGFFQSDFKSKTKYDYNEIIHKSILFYEAQRSGKLPAGNRIPWRGDSGLKDGCDVGHDLTGGWYDAGDDVKFGFPMAYSATVLAWGMIEFQEAYIDAGEWQNALDMLKWATDYFIKAHAAPNVLYVQIGDPVRDHSKWWRPEDFLVDRKSYKIDIRHPGTEVAAETAAALAAASIVFRDVNSSYADTLVQHSKELYRFADRRRKTYHESVQSVRNFYKSWNGYNDELLWAAVWLHKATNESSFLKKAEDRYDAYGANEVPQEFSWDDKYAGVQVLLAQETGHIKYRDAVKAFVDLAINTRKTPHGLTWLIKWGSNRYAANFALIALMASKIEPELPERHSYVRYARKQIHCMLGSGDGRRSYVVGFGHNPPKHVHHRASSCPQWRQRPVSQCTFESFRNPAPNPHVLYGALVGGPNLDGEYTDVRDDYVRNEVAVDYNAGFQSAVAGLKYFYKHPTNE
uniref:Endoglucanase n=1 Tax=Phallusia mammillata TaxID=59560 RepID=A0A6F9DJC5_9ASCI|nr:endoglucanase 22 [Phallusia mammillata]